MIADLGKSLLDPAPWEGMLYSGGWKPARGGATDVVDKATGTVLGRIGVATAADVAEACAAAAAAAPAWAARPAAKRAAILRRAADLLEGASAELTPWVVRETGGIPAKAGFEIHGSAAELREAATLAEVDTRRAIAKDAEHESFAIRVPLGVVGIITPWNFPMLLAMRSLAPALALGNAVVLKPDIQTAVSGGVALVQVLLAAGLPADVLHLVPGDAEPGAALTSDPNVAMISFTGSTAVGRLVGEAAGRGLKRVSLELGGNSPFIVLDDADLELATSAGAFGSFFHQGQICMASSRHLVHADIAEAYAKRLAERATNAAIGDPHTGNVLVGPLINQQQLDRVRGIVDRSVAAGAHVAAGGTNDGRFFRPTVLTDVTPQMPAFAEEIFGPVAPITTFRTDDEAVALANMTEYGLSSAIFSRDVERALRIAARLKTGMAHINDQTVNDNPQAPFGGFGASGNGGRFGGHANLDEFTAWRWMTVRQTGHPYPF